MVSGIENALTALAVAITIMKKVKGKHRWRSLREAHTPNSELRTPNSELRTPNSGRLGHSLTSHLLPLTSFIDILSFINISKEN